MTQYEDTEASAHDGAPVEGYKFTGTLANYYYTSAEQDVSIGGQTYTAIAIERAAIRAGTQEDDNLDLQLTLPVDIALVQDYGLQITAPDLDVEVFRFHQGDNPATDYVVIWKGPVTSFSISGKEAKIRVPSIFTTMLQGQIPNIYYQNPCNNILYDDRCQVNPASWTTATTVVSITDSLTVIVGADGFDDSVLVAGEIINTTKSERRLVIDNVSNVITFNYAFSNIETGDSITLRAGCDHSFAICKSKFSNQVNYGGFPYVPSDNPFMGEL